LSMPAWDSMWKCVDGAYGDKQDAMLDIG
jgi:hypothetical protein